MLKYDNSGNKRRTTGGVVISSGTNKQQCTWSSNQDYRNRTIAASGMTHIMAIKTAGM